MCLKFDERFKDLIKDAVEINPYSSRFRYPDDFADPEPDEVQDAIECSDRIFKLVQDRIHHLVTGQQEIFE